MALAVVDEKRDLWQTIDLPTVESMEPIQSAVALLASEGGVITVARKRGGDPLPENGRKGPAYAVTVEIIDGTGTVAVTTPLNLSPGSTDGATDARTNLYSYCRITPADRKALSRVAFRSFGADTRRCCRQGSGRSTIMRQSFLRKSAVAMAAAFTFLSVAPTFAQTQGMERRNDRRNARQSGRAAKNACKAGDEKTRVECRQQKRAVKNSARPLNQGTTAPAPNPAQ